MQGEGGLLLTNRQQLVLPSHILRQSGITMIMIMLMLMLIIMLMLILILMMMMKLVMMVMLLVMMIRTSACGRSTPDQRRCLQHRSGWWVSSSSFRLFNFLSFYFLSFYFLSFHIFVWVEGRRHHYYLRISFAITTTKALIHTFSPVNICCLN